MKIVIHPKLWLKLGSLLLTICLSVNQFLLVNAQSPVLTLQNFPRFPPLTNITASPQSTSVFKPFGTLAEAETVSSLASITIPCTRNCTTTCDYCQSGLCVVEPVCYANCQKEALDCWSLVELYKGYMSGYVQHNVTDYRLSSQVKNALAPYIELAIGKPRSQLEEITVGTSGNAGKDNAMTDCDRITWINSPTGNQIEHALRGAHRNDSDILLYDGDKGVVHWVYHEFIHTFQCDELGGRTEYAYNWWSELPIALQAANADPTQIHDHQPSEQNADSRGLTILQRMPMIVPRYVMGIKRLGAQLSGSNITFVANAHNALTNTTVRNVKFDDKLQFIILDENNRPTTLTATPVTGQSIKKIWSNGTATIQYIEGDFQASWTIPASLEGQRLRYKFEIRDKQNYLMDESALQSLAIVKRYIYVNQNYAGGNNDGTKTRPYRTIQAALTDPDIGQAIGLRIAGGAYTVSSSLNVPLVIESDDGSLVTIRRETGQLLSAATVPTVTMNTTINTTGNGVVVLDPPGGVYTINTVVQLTATPDVGFVFNGWDDQALGTADPISLTMNENKTLSAIFVQALPADEFIYLPLILR